MNRHRTLKQALRKLAMLTALTGAALMLAATLSAAEGKYGGGWRIQLRSAAVVRGETVTLGEIGDPVGQVDPAVWAKLAEVPLWPSPPPGKPMNMTKPKVQQAMAHYARELSAICVYPASMTLQQGGEVVDAAGLERIVVKSLTPVMRTLPGEASLQDFRLPSSVFLSRPGQTVELETPADLTPGRVSLRFAIIEPGGAVVRRVTGTVFLDLWAEVPAAATPLNKDEILTPERVTYVRKNLAHLKGLAWDGRGGPWRMQRAVASGQPIMQTDVSVIPTVQKGATVTMLFQGKNFTLTMPGEALSDGAHGETIAVRNLQSRKQLRATVRDGLTVVVR